MGKKEIEKDLNVMKKYCTVIRVIAHTQVWNSTEVKQIYLNFYLKSIVTSPS